MAKLIDLTHLIKQDMPVYPGDLPVNLKKSHDVTTDGFTNHRLDAGMHIGTHLDAPWHMIPGGVTIDNIPLTSLWATGCLLDVRDQPVITAQKEYEQLIPKKSIVLLHTGWDKYFGGEDYYTKHPVVDESFVSLLVERQVRILGMDSPSPDRPPFAIHKKLFSAGILLLENLTNLQEIPLDRPFEVVALPIKMSTDGALARVVVRA